MSGIIVLGTLKTQPQQSNADTSKILVHAFLRTPLLKESGLVIPLFSSPPLFQLLLVFMRDD